MLDKLIKNIKRDKLYLSATAGFISLAIAFLAEIILNLSPCMLCLYQRFVYLLIFAASFLGIIIPIMRKPFVALVMFLLLLELGLAVYHTSIEHYLIEDSYICSPATVITSNFQKWLTFKKLASSCSEGVFRFMNFSMAEWNIVYSSIIIFYFFKRKK